MNVHSEINRRANVAQEPARHQPPEQGTGLLDLIRVLRSRSRLILFPAAAVVALTLIVVSQLTPMYTANAVVMLDQRKNNVEDVNAVLSGLPTDPSSVQNQVLILTSRALAAGVINQLHLDQDLEFNTRVRWKWRNLLTWLSEDVETGLNVSINWIKQELQSRSNISTEWLTPISWRGWDTTAQADEQATQEEQDKLVDKFLGSLDVTPINQSTAITVSFRSRDRNSAAKIANAIANAYVEDQLNAKFEATQKATQWLSARIQQLSGQVQVAEAAVQQYRLENNLTETADGNSIVNQQLAALSGQVVLARSDLAAKQAAYNRVKMLVNSGHSADVSQVVASPLISQLRAQETDLSRQEAQLSVQYGPRHPKMLDLISEKKNLEGKIGEEVRRVIETVANDVAIAQANLQSLQNSMADLEATSHGESKATIKLKALETNADSVRSMYQAFLSRLKEIQGQEGIQTADARVVSPATVPTAPSFPRPLLTVGASIPAGLAIGLILALFAERLDAGFRTPSQVEKFLGLPVLVAIPEIALADRQWGKTAVDRIVDKPMSEFTEAVRGLQLSLELSNADRKPKVILVASAMPGEGKTTVAVGLGRTAARNGKKVVVVDADLRQPAVAKAVRLGVIKNGIIENLTGEATLDQCVFKDPKSDLLVLPVKQTKQRLSNAIDLLDSHMMEKLIVDLRSTCDLVIIDSAPLLPVSDSKILLPLCDDVLLVTRWGSTPREAVADVARSITGLGVGIAGVALTRVDMARFRYYSYQGNYKYKEYYIG